VGFALERQSINTNNKCKKMFFSTFITFSIKVRFKRMCFFNISIHEVSNIKCIPFAIIL